VESVAGNPTPERIFAAKPFRTAAALLEPRLGSLGKSRVGPRSISRMLPPGAEPLRQQPPRKNAGSWPVRLTILPSVVGGARPHHGRGAGSVRGHTHGRGRQARSARQLAQEHTAGLGLPLGPHRAPANIPSSRVLRHAYAAKRADTAHPANSPKLAEQPPATSTIQ
jgi:hypothetical protein